KTDDPAFQKNVLLRRHCSYPKHAEDEASRAPGSPARPAVAADDSMAVCCCGAKFCLVKLAAGTRHDVATSRPTVGAHIRVSTFYKYRDRRRAGNQPCHIKSIQYPT